MALPSDFARIDARDAFPAQWRRQIDRPNGQETRMRHHIFPAVAALATLAAFPAAAQEVERYQLERTEEGYVRLDTVTGRMSICQEDGGQLVCKVAVEERQAYERRFDELHDRLDALDARIAALEAADPEAELPDEEEFERTMTYMERFFRRFMGIVDDLERDFGEEEPQPEPNPQSDRT